LILSLERVISFVWMFIVVQLLHDRAEIVREVLPRTYDLDDDHDHDQNPKRPNYVRFVQRQMTVYRYLNRLRCDTIQEYANGAAED
jgi:hypothetical protein